MQQWTGEFEYDPQGNLTLSDRGDTTIEYEYNVRNQLASAENTAGSTTTAATYEYDHDGMQVRRSESDGTTTATEFLVRDPLSPYGYSRVVEKRTSGGVLLASFIHGREPIAEVTATSKHYLLADAHSGVRTIVNSASNAIQFAAYDSFGGLLTAAPTISSEHLYRTESFDNVSGQYYLRARHYNPLLTTFSQQDPYSGDIDNPISLHRFQFADRDGVQKHDPTGMFSVSISLGMIAIAGGQLAVASHNVQQGDRAAALHMANLMTQIMLFNLLTSFSEEPILAGHLMIGSAYWQTYLRPKMYENAAKLKPTPKRLVQLAGLVALQAAGNAVLHATGVPIKISGHPNFTGLLYSRASLGISRWQSSTFILYSGFRSYRGNPLDNDIRRSNLAMTALAPMYPQAYAFHPQGINGQASGYSWHHHEVVGVMMLVKQKLGHAAVKHTGGVFYWSFAHGITKYGR